MGMEGMDPLRVALRAQDVQTSTQDINLGPLNAEIKNIRLIGMTARLALHIRGTEVIKDYKRLEYIAGQLGVDALALPSVLSVLEELGWVRVRSSANRNKIVEESVPYFRDLYPEMGRYYQEHDHSEIEDGLIRCCDDLAVSPITEGEMRNQMGLDNKALGLVLDIGKSGKLIQSYQAKSTGEKVYYSPVYWVEHPDKMQQMYELLKKYGAAKVYRTFEKIRDYQGMPLAQDVISGDNVTSEEMKILAEAIRRGIILAPVVDSHSGAKLFAFTPYVGISVEEKIILEKAMAVLACVRYGQHFGAITKIKYPGRILDVLLEPPHTIGPHTEIKKQYAILVGRGVGRIYPDRSQPDRCFFQLISTDENTRAVELARDLLNIGEVMERKGFSQDLHDVFFYEGSYEEAMRTVPKVKEPAQLSPESRERVSDIINDVMDKLRGATF